MIYNKNIQSHPLSPPPPQNTRKNLMAEGDEVSAAGYVENKDDRKFMARSFVIAIIAVILFIVIIIIIIFILNRVDVVVTRHHRASNFTLNVKLDIENYSVSAGTMCVLCSTNSVNPLIHTTKLK